MSPRSTAAWLVLALAMSSTAAADPQTLDANDELTRRIIQRQADAARGRRHRGAVALVALGVGVTIGGYFLVRHSHENHDDLVDLSGIEAAYGYTAMVVGGLTAINGPIMLISRTEQEDLHGKLETSIARGDGRAGVARARVILDERAESSARSRRILRGMGWALLGVGAAGGITYLVARDDIDRGTGNVLLAGSLVAGLGGGTVLLASRSRGAWEEANDDVRRSRTAGVVPVRSGALLAIAGTF